MKANESIQRDPLQPPLAPGNFLWQSSLPKGLLG